MFTSLFPEREKSKNFILSRGEWAQDSHRSSAYCHVAYLVLRCASPASLSRFFRNQLKAWLIRHLVASNEGDKDLMAKAIAADGHDGDSLMGDGGYAGKGAPGRESSLSGRVRTRKPAPAPFLSVPRRQGQSTSRGR